MILAYAYILVLIQGTEHDVSTLQCNQAKEKKFRKSLGWKTPFHGGSPFSSLHKRTRHWLFLVISHVITLF